ncbi:hypothetical protein WSM22_40930 [Cytophagales bacterium WSM2-2]|nr:hypothetical protein WSM22_40930 [Cytophagales bacterium WSM2-2]
MLKKTFFIFSFLIQVESIRAQQSSYSLYDANPVFTNLAGITIQNQRQVSVGFKSIGLDGGDKIMLSSLRYLNPLMFSGKKKGAVDVNVFTEQTGVNGIFQQSGVILGGAYDVNITEEHKLSFGLQGGAVFRTVNENRIRTDNQYSNGAFDPNAPSGETISNWKKTTVIINSGLNWTYTPGQKSDKAKGTPRAWAGLSFYNLNQTNATFYSDDKRVPIRFIFSGGYVFRFNQFEITPTARGIYEASIYQWNGGALLDYLVMNASDLQKIGCGIWYSNAKSAIFSLRVSHVRYMITAGYELPLNADISGTAMSNAIETHLAWKF